MTVNFKLKPITACDQVVPPQGTCLRDHYIEDRKRKGLRTSCILTHGLVSFFSQGYSYAAAPIYVYRVVRHHNAVFI